MKEFCVSRQLCPLSRPGASIGVRRLLLIALALLAIGCPRPATAQPVRAELKAVVENGFARLDFTLEEEVPSQVRAAGGILIITFRRPVDISFEKLDSEAAGYISAVRRDPDGRGLRIALARKVTVNSMSAAERLFVDLLPETRVGLPPGLPRSVIDALAQRARDAERKARAQRMLARQAKLAPIRVRVASQPTFTRYVFELPELIGVAVNSGKDRLTVSFDTLLKFDLADAKAMLPPAISAIDSETENETVSVRFAFSRRVDVRTFREDLNYVVDVTPMEGVAPRSEGSVRSDELSAFAAQLAGKVSTPVGLEAPPTVPAAAPAPPVAPAVAPAVVAPATVTLPEAAAAPVAATPPRHEDAAAPQAERADQRLSSNAAAPAAAPPAAPVPAAAAVRPADPGDGARPSGDATIDVGLKRDGETLILSFPFASPTPAAVFRRSDTLWLVFDTDVALNLAAFERQRGRTIADARLIRRADAAVLRIKLERPRLVSATANGPVWTITLGSEVVDPTRPLGIGRNVVGAARASVTVAFDEPRRLHRLVDPDAGDVLLVVTALGPSRAFVRNQDFVEFRALAATHGMVVQPLADDLSAELAADKVVLSRPAGLTVSSFSNGGADAAGAVHAPQVIDPQTWGFDRGADFVERKFQLIGAAADAPEAKRLAARTDLARFYLARDMAVEAKAVLDVALADTPATDDATPVVLRAIANIMLRRPEQALRDLANPIVGNQHDAPLWRALAQARQGRWGEAREGFRSVGMAMGALPIELQREIMKDMVRASIEVGDITGALKELNEFEIVGVPRELEPTLSVLTGRLAERLGRVEDALRSYRAAADSWDRPAAAQGRLRELTLRHTAANLTRGEALAELETLTTVWRGDETEVEALSLLARLYTEEQRYRDAFHVMRTALKAHPNSEMTRRIHDEAAQSFDGLFLAGRGDALPAIDALSLFYDFRDLTPIGRRGDEMIRRLADRLVSVDLLDQAAELLQHQVDHRLQGAARAQVASRLAVVYLMNRKPDRALAALRTSRSGELANELRGQRLLLEARALSETGRHDVALEVVANLEGREAARLRVDILWAARRWREAGEEIERLYGERWSEFEPLTDTERFDMLRAGIAFVLGEDAIGLARFRERYSSKMGEGPDRRAFDVVTAPVDKSGAEFRDVARAIASTNTLDAFLRDLRARYPDAGAARAGVQRTRGTPPPGAASGAAAGGAG